MRHTRKASRKTSRKNRKQIRRKRTIRRRRGGQLNPNAPEFVPTSNMRNNAPEFVPTRVSTMRANANEFIPTNIQNQRNASFVENMASEGDFNEEKFPSVNLNFLNENKAKPNWNIKKPVLGINAKNVTVPKKIKNIWAKNNSQ